MSRATILTLYSQLKKQHNLSSQWWPTSGKFVPIEFEIVVGAVITQNTSWGNVEKALANLIEAKKLSAKAIAETQLPTLQRIVKPSGFYKQKAKRLRNFCRFIATFEGDFYKDITREQLLAINGIGHETADSILLYACNKPSFVIDAYTRRLLTRMKIINGKEKYDEIKAMFENKLPNDVDLYKEFHALVVENEKAKAKSK